VLGLNFGTFGYISTMNGSEHLGWAFVLIVAVVGYQLFAYSNLDIVSLRVSRKTLALISYVFAFALGCWILASALVMEYLFQHDQQLKPRALWLVFSIMSYWSLFKWFQSIIVRFASSRRSQWL
jgi:hypothetical protein